jgi:C4-dicarboxylate-specific signal transduction histidine kinase
VARPLREQFAIASFLLLAPVAVVMVIAAGAAYRQELDQVYQQSETFARVIAGFIDTAGPGSDANLEKFLDGLPVPRGSQVLITGENGQVETTHRYFAGSEPEMQLASGSATLRSRTGTVTVGIANSLAWQRAVPNYRATIAISGIATVVLVVAQVLFLRRLLPALRGLERSAMRVGAGDLNVRFEERMPSLELEHVRDAFHDMVDKLRAAREAIDRQMQEERRMNAELQSLQQQVIRQERLAAIGVLVSGIAHELNNPLQAISGFSELLQRDPAMGAQAKSDLALIHQESARASAIIRNLSRFGRQQPSAPVAVDLGEVLASVIELRQRRFAEQDIRLERDERATRPAHGVFTELQQVVLNFVINAEHAVRVRDAGSRRITLRTRDDDDGVRLEVEDSGTGVPPENESKLFQPFFTTKPVGEGTGLGLSVSYGIIHSLGGEIGYRRGAQGGALFYFKVPASGAPAA